MVLHMIKILIEKINGSVVCLKVMLKETGKDHTVGDAWDKLKKAEACI